MANPSQETLLESLRVAKMRCEWARASLIAAQNDLRVETAEVAKAEAALLAAFPGVSVSLETTNADGGQHHTEEVKRLSEALLAQGDTLIFACATEILAPGEQFVIPAVGGPSAQMPELGRSLLGTLGFALVRAIDIGLLKVDGDSFPDSLVNQTEALQGQINSILGVVTGDLPCTDEIALPIHRELIDYIELCALYDMAGGQHVFS